MDSSNRRKLKPIGVNNKKQSKKKSKSKSTAAVAFKNKESVAQLISRTQSSLSLSDVADTLQVPEDRMKYMGMHSQSHNDFQFPDDDDVSSLNSKRRKPKAKSMSRIDNMSVMSPTSFRSVDSLSVADTEYSHQSKLTTREMMREIDYRAKHNLAPPDYVPSFEELAPVHLSWNKKISRRSSPRRSSPRRGVHAVEAEDFEEPAVEQPPINIIGCMHPIELILACADKRTRKQAKAQRLKKVKCEQKSQEIHASIEFKFSRAERYAAILAHKQRQVAWMKILVMAQYLHKLRERFAPRKEKYESMLLVAESASRIQRFCRHWYERHLFIKIHLKFLRMMRRNELAFKMHVRVWRKRAAVKKLMTFFAEYKSSHQIPRIVHKYLMGVRKVQSSMRDFLSCKQAKIVVLGRIWEKLEIRYIKRKLEERKAQKRGLVAKISAHNNATLDEDEAGAADFLQGGVGSEADTQFKVEMKNQAKLWNKLDARMETKIRQLKASGVIVEEEEAETVRKLMLPEATRNTVLARMLEGLRKEFYTCQKMIVRKQAESDSVFKESHALDLLLGRTNDITRIINEKFDKRLVKLSYKPFMLFSHISSKMVYDKVREAHRLHETFKIKIDATSSVPDLDPRQKAHMLQRMRTIRNLT